MMLLRMLFSVQFSEPLSSEETAVDNAIKASSNACFTLSPQYVPNPELSVELNASWIQRNGGLPSNNPHGNSFLGKNAPPFKVVMP